MISGIIARARSLWRGLRNRDRIDADMEEEFRSHIAMRTADLVRTGLPRAEAERRARQEFGRPERYKREGAAQRGLRVFDELGVSWLDFKLGFRMLARYPGLTFVAGFAIAFAIWTGAGTFEFLNQLVNPTLPLPQGDRIVAIELRDVAESRDMPRVLNDYRRWQAELRSVDELGAYRTTVRNLITASGQAEPAAVAEVTVSAMRVARVEPSIGRGFAESDESPTAPLVALLGHELWQQRFGSDLGVIGQTIRIGTDPATIIGIMPEGFAYPLSHEVWTPLRLAPHYEPAEGPAVSVVGRLADGVALVDARRDLAALGRRTAAELPATHANVRPRMVPFALSWLDLRTADKLTLRSLNLFLVLLLAIVGSNVALLLFARAASREGEIAVRNAIGASRTRIVTQLFAEALVLGAFGCALGLAALRFGMRWGIGIAAEQAGGSLPFWIRADLSPLTAVYAAGLTLLVALIAGVLPALRLTRGVGARLRRSTAGGGGPKFGGVWTAIIVTQVALTVLLPSIAFHLQKDMRALRTVDLGFAAGEFLTFRVTVDAEAVAKATADTSKAALLEHAAARTGELERRLMADPAVEAVTTARRLPLMYHQWNQIEVDAGAVPPPDERGHRLASTAVRPDYFATLGVELQAGRSFAAADLATDASVVIVNESFVQDVLGGRNAIGRRIRYVADESDRRPREGPWHEIVGVVQDLGTHSGYGRAGIYHPLGTAANPVYLAVRTRGNPADLTPRIRPLAAAVDPAVRIDELQPLDRVIDAEMRFYSFWFRLTLLLCAVVLLLSLSGIYAVMAFTVARRTREIGIRVALGADRHRVVLAIFRRPLAQVTGGVAAGLVLAAAPGLLIHQRVSPSGTALVVLYGALMLAVCLVACVVPTRRALAVEPTEALRSDG